MLKKVKTTLIPEISSFGFVILLSKNWKIGNRLKE